MTRTRATRLHEALRAGTAAALAAATFSVPSATGATPRPAPTLTEALAQHLRKPPIRDRSQMAVVIARVGSAEPILSYNGETPLILASTTKLFTTAAAFDRLGRDYRFRTRLYLDAEVGADGTLPGRLVVVGGGDPGLSGRFYGDDPLAVFAPWAEAVARRGARRVRDGLVLDTSFFDDELFHPDWPDEQEQFWWQAPTSALSYNDNVVLVRAVGGLRAGAPALLGFTPAGPPLLSLIGRVVTASGRGARVGVRRPPGSRTVVASGLLGRSRIWTGDVTVPDPPLYLAAALTKALEARGVAVEGAPAVRSLPRREPLPGETLLHVHETPLVRALEICNKRSQSFYAEQILKTLGAERRGKGTWENGRAEVTEFLRSLGLRSEEYRLADGSGRSRANRTSARAYVDFLQALAGRWSGFDEFLPTLAISGDPEGSLRRRLRGEETLGKVYAKTGNIAGVVTLAGYVTAKSGDRYAFAILLNGGCSDGRGHAWQDRLLSTLARLG